MNLRQQLNKRWNNPPRNLFAQKLNEFFDQRLKKAFEYRDNHPENPILYFAPENLTTLLKQLPPIDNAETPGKIDLRGLDFRSSDLTLDNINLSFSPSFTLHNCHAVNSDFNDIKKAIDNLSGYYENCSMQDSNFNKASLRNSVYIKCNFANSRMTGIHAIDSKFKDCDFENVNFYFSSLYGSDLRGCNFNGADLSRCVLDNVIIDKTTDFRGAKLFDLLDEGKELWKKGTWDETTLTGSNPSDIHLKYMKAVLVVSKDYPGPWVEQLKQKVKALMKIVEKYPNYEWEVELKKSFPDKNNEIEDLLKEASKLF